MVEDDVVVVMVVRVTVTGMAAALTEDRKEKVLSAKADRVAHLEKANQKPSPASSGLTALTQTLAFYNLLCRISSLMRGQDLTLHDVAIQFLRDSSG